MNMKISDMMDQIRDDSVPIQIQDAASTQRIKEAAIKKIREAEVRHPRKPIRLLFVAAVLVTAFFAAAFTIYTLTLENYRGPTIKTGGPLPTQTDCVCIDDDGNIVTELPVKEEATMRFMPNGTIQSRAGEEWTKWLVKWAEEDKNKYVPFNPDWDNPELRPYLRNNANDQEARDKLDEILEKYGLTSRGEDIYLLNMEEFYDYVGVRDFLPKVGGPHDMNTMSTWNGIPLRFCYSGNGDFGVCDSAELPDGRNYVYNIANVNKKTFTYGGLVARDVDEYETWNYTTKDGTKVVLAMNEDTSILKAELEHSYVSISFSSGTENLGNGGTDASDFAKGMPTVDKATLEELAECFDFTVINSLAE